LYFTNSQILTTDASPSSIAISDFNRDGNLDLAVANNGSGTVSIFLGNGDGTFQPKVDYATIASPVGITTADLRGNGILDLGRHERLVHQWNGVGLGQRDHPEEYETPECKGQSLTPLRPP
jgi:hypothetical protein